MGAFYRATIGEFLVHQTDEVLGSLLRSYQHNELQKRQTEAWKIEIKVLKAAFEGMVSSIPSCKKWTLLLEYPIPRRSKRLDAVILASELIFCLEFKTRDAKHTLQPKRQVEDYALDLRDFHEASKDRKIIPMVVVPDAPSIQNESSNFSESGVCEVVLTSAADFGRTLLSVYKSEHQEAGKVIDPVKWDNSPYRPVPTIIEAAETLFARHNVREISQAGATNLTETSDRLIQIIKNAQRERKKVICFVTGVPGAGKTLAGLNVVHNPELRQENRPAGIFLSGNVPLVKTIRAAINRDYKQRERAGEGDRISSTFIQPVHAFVEAYAEKSGLVPVDKVVIFDEAQRAWNSEHNQKKKGLSKSEPEILLSIMDRNPDWAVVIALVGGGQEIHSGEGGLSEWGRTLREKYPQWKIFVSPQALEKDVSTAGHLLFADGDSGSLKIQREPSLHLNVSQRSFKAKKFAEWVEAALAGDSKKAAKIVDSLRDYPFALTRSLSTARDWLKTNARGLQRAGLLASSGAIRLRAEGIELSSGFRQGNREMFINWFLNHWPDVRSSNQLEVAASEFECQGLELDWVGLCWGGDFMLSAATKQWIYRKFIGSRWGNVSEEQDRKFVLNKYRVLLTRARRGLVIWIPEGEETDETRSPENFDSTAAYLINCGVPLI